MNFLKVTFSIIAVLITGCVVSVWSWAEYSARSGPFAFFNVDDVSSGRKVLAAYLAGEPTIDETREYLVSARFRCSSKIGDDKRSRNADPDVFFSLYCNYGYGFPGFTGPSKNWSVRVEADKQGIVRPH